MAELQFPNIVGQFQQGQDRGRSLLATKLAGQAFSAPPEQRQSALSQLAGVNPNDALTMQSNFRAQDAAQAATAKAQEVDHSKKVQGAATFMVQALQSKDPARIQGAWQAVHPYFSEVASSQGVTLPDEWNDSLTPGLYKILGQNGGMPQQKGTVVAPGGALVDSATGQQMFANPAAPANGQLVDIPDGQGGTVKMLFDPKTRQLSQPNYGGVQAQPEQPAPDLSAINAKAGELVNSGQLTPEQGDAWIKQQYQGAGMQIGGHEAPALPTPSQMGHAPPKSSGELDKRIALARSMGATEEQVKQMVLGQAATNGAPDVPGNASATGDAYLQSLDGQTAAQVKALADGRMAFPTGTALKSPYWQGMIGAVSQYDPSFDAINYNARSGTRKAFTSGKEAQTVNALNTAAEHLGTLSDYADALHNTSFQPLNALKNGIANMTGDPRIARFNTTKKAAADEVTKVWRASGGSEADIKEAMKNFDGAQSPEQLQAAIGTVVQLIGGKLSALQDQYKQGMGTERNAKALVSPEARRAYEKVLNRAGMTSDTIGQQAQQPASGGVDHLLSKYGVQ